MSKLLRWAGDYVSRYERLVKDNTSAQNIVVSGPQIELYAVAKAIIEDAAQPVSRKKTRDAK